MTKSQRTIFVIGISGILAIGLVAACTDNSAPVTYAQPPQAAVMAQPMQAPVTVVQAAPAPANDGFFTGMLMGHLMSGGGGGGYSRNTTVINRSVTNVTRVAPRTVYTPRPSYSYSRPSYSSSRSSSFGSFRSRR
jgi:hypothetical protein